MMRMEGFMRNLHLGQADQWCRAGDSMVAGFMAGYMEKQDYQYAFHMGIAAEVPAHFLRILPPEKRLRLSISRSSDRIRRKGRNENYRLTGC